ncbi:MAG: hypothetical protein AAFP70_01410 [Calditrichota bacterium]
MQTKFSFRELIKYRAGALCLIGILSATFLHSTTFMAQFFYDSLILGAIAAFAIDAGVVAMSIFKDELLQDGELAWMVRTVTCIVLFASGVANMSEGFKSAYDIQLTYSSLMSLDPLTWVQWLAGTIIFPVLAYVMCDTIGTRNLAVLRTSGQLIPMPQNYGQLSGARPQPRPAKPELKPSSGANKSRQKQERLRQLKRFVETHPDATLTEMAASVGVTSKTVRGYLNELGHSGQFTSNPSKFSAN